MAVSGRLKNLEAYLKSLSSLNRSDINTGTWIIFCWGNQNFFKIYFTVNYLGLKMVNFNIISVLNTIKIFKNLEIQFIERNVWERLCLHIKNYLFLHHLIQYFTLFSFIYLHFFAQLYQIEFSIYLLAVLFSFFIYFLIQFIIVWICYKHFYLFIFLPVFLFFHLLNFRKTHFLLFIFHYL